MNIKEKAKIFAINAHQGQIRKNEPDKPMIIHPLSVGKLLEDYNYSDNIVAAGYLHDVVEDTKYTIEDIEKEFGQEVANLVMSASEKDKTLSWEERKKHTIEEVKKLPLKNKLVICADKINNLEDLYLKFAKNGQRDFSNFKRGEEKHKWYYTNIYENLIKGENKNLPIFKRLKKALDLVFNYQEDEFLKNTIFKDNEVYYQKLQKLHAQKLELENLKSLCNLKKPFIIEFTGTPRTGKTTTINNLYDFFKKGNFNIELIEEFTTSKYYKQKYKEKLIGLNQEEINLKILEETAKQLKEAIKKEKDIILIDRSINDRQIWNYRRYQKQDMTKEKYLEAKSNYSKISKELIDFLAITYTDALTALKRDYNNSLALEERTFLNITNLKEYNESLKKVKDLLTSSVDNYCFIDTTNKNLNDISLEVAESVMPLIRKKFITAFKEKYNVK